MKIEGTNWNLVDRTEGAIHVSRVLDNTQLRMRITETFGKYKLSIGHSFKFYGNTYYDLKSNDIISACNEADDIAREEFTRMVEWYTNLVKEMGDN